MQLSNSQVRHLRRLAHHLKPVVLVGQHGLKETVMEEIQSALDTHELIKVRLSLGDRDERQQAIDQILRETDSRLIQQIGHVAVLFRRNQKKPKIVLPA